MGTTSTGVPWECGLPLPKWYIIFGATVILLNYYAFLCPILVLLLPLIPYFVHFALSKVLMFYDDNILLTCQH